jgi:hemoglobin-like flavoprotein
MAVVLTAPQVDLPRSSSNNHRSKHILPSAYRIADEPILSSVAMVINREIWQQILEQFSTSGYMVKTTLLTAAA